MPSDLPQRMAISPTRLDRPDVSWSELLDRWSAWFQTLEVPGKLLIQIRTRALAAADLYRLVREARGWCAGGSLVVSRRVDVALAAGADGVQLPEDGLHAERVRQLAGADFLIGRSVHSVEGARQAARDGADWVTLSPVFASLGKNATTPPLGLGVLGRAAACGVPVFALGGITVGNERECRQHGAHGVAGISLFDASVGGDATPPLT